MMQPIYQQDTLPDFEKAMAEAQQQGLDKTDHIAKQYIHFAKMEHKCHHAKTLALIHRQKQRLMAALGR